MRVAILTSRERHTASLAIPVLAESEGIDLALVVLNTGEGVDRRRRLRKKLRKARSIGLLGALNGLRIRPWFGRRVSERLDVPSLETLCRRHRVPLVRTPRINCERTRTYIAESAAELGLSLGNAWIGPKLFSIPENGMINVHHEVLPDYRGALPVIWQIHNGSTETGYTIHRIDRRIDTGAILLQERLGIEFQASLAETATHNYVRLLRASVRGLVETIRHFEGLASTGRPQGAGTSYTTPTFRQYRRMIAQHRRLSTSERRVRI